MTENNPHVSIIIVTYNSAKVIVQCIDSIIKNSGDIKYEILVIDNGSTDDTSQLIDKTYGSKVSLFSGHGNIGFAGGNNLGMSKAKGKHFFLINPDTIMHIHCLQSLVKYANKNPLTGIIAPKLLNTDGSTQHSTFKFPNIAQAFYGFFEKLTHINSTQNGRYSLLDYDKERDVEHILGAAMFVQKSFWEDVGGMDVNYKLYFEETDWCYKAHKNNWTLRYIPSAILTHIGAHSTKASPITNSITYAQSQAKFYKKHYGRFTYILLKAITILGVNYWLMRSSYSLIKGKITFTIYKKLIISYVQIIIA